MQLVCSRLLDLSKADLFTQSSAFRLDEELRRLKQNRLAQERTVAAVELELKNSQGVCEVNSFCICCLQVASAHLFRQDQTLIRPL